MHDITYIVEIVAHFISALLERKTLIDRLESLSYRDSLTGLNNRHAITEADALMYENKRAYYASCKMKV